MPPRRKTFADDRGKPIMTSFMSLWVWLGLSFISADDLPSPRQPQPTFRVIADLKHTGILSEPLASRSANLNEFGIAVPLPAAGGGRDRWPEKLDVDDPNVKRLGRLRVEATPAAGDIVISIQSDSRRSLRLFRNDADGWRRQSASEDHSWTLTPGKDGVAEVGVGVMIPEPTADSARKVWPRAFTVEISTKSQSGTRLRVPFRVAPYVIPSALDPVDELLIVSQAITADSVRSVRVFTASTGLALVIPRSTSCATSGCKTRSNRVFSRFRPPRGSVKPPACLIGLRKRSGPASGRLDHQVATWLRRQGVVTVPPASPASKRVGTTGTATLNPPLPIPTARGADFPVAD